MLPFSKIVPLAVIAALVPLALTQLALSQDEPRIFRADTKLVVLHASVVDKSGKLVPNLKKEAFHVFEDKVEQPIKTFRREDVPVSLGLIIDNSGSMRDKRKKVEAAALAMVKASNPNDEVTIVNFNDEFYQDVTFTSDMKKLEEGVTRIDSRGGTAMRDAISATIDYMKAKGKHDKKVIVVITDGDDNASTMTLEKLVERARQSEVLFYMIGLLNEEEKRSAKKAKRALETLAEASGGSAIFPKEMNEVETATLQFAHEIRNQYIIAYTPTNANLDGGFRAVKVTVNGPNKPMVRTRTGYYATPDKPKSAELNAPAQLTHKQ
jgi:Ca-activated chloride channel family protein